MDRHRGDRFGNNPDSPQYRPSRGPPRDGPMNHHRRSPNSFRGGFSGGGGDGPHHRPFDSPPRFPPGGGGGGGFRPMGGGGGGFNSNFEVPLTGQKRGYPFSGRGGSPGSDRFDGGSFAKLFVGSVPRTATEEDIRPLFEEHGNVVEVALIKDKRTGQQQGCCFIKYATSEEADRAIRGLHNQHTLPGGVGPIQVRYADGERERLVEYKLFVGSLNKHATEKEVEEIFSPYGRVEDVYLMRDELKQSRGCGFVKFSQREMAMEAINALNGLHTMRGCDQPLIVRFADPKRPRAGESRVAPALGGPGFGTRFPAPGFRPTPNLGEPIRGGPPNSWHQMSQQNFGPSPNAAIHGFGGQLLSRSGDAAISLTPGGPPAGPGGSADGSIPGLAVSSSSTTQQSFNQSLAQVPPPIGQQISPLQKTLQSPQQLPSSLQPQTQNLSSYSQTQTPNAPLRQLGQPQIPHSAGQTPFSQPFPSQQFLGLSPQLPVSQSQAQQNATAGTAQAPLGSNQAQLAAPVQQQLHQPLHQSPSQLAQMLSQQTQTLQASFQSSQQAFSQLQQQLQMMQPSNQTLMPQQGSQAAKQQSPWAGIVPQTVGGTTAVAPVTEMPLVTSAAPVVPVVNQAVAPVKCNWTEHTSPDGYKYYYNSITGESKWEKPEELALFEQQQQKPAVQQPQTQSHPQALPMQQVPQTQMQLQTQVQTQLRHPQQLHQTSYQSTGVAGHQNIQELAYARQVAASSVNDPTRFPQGHQAAQEWMWKNKPTGT